MAVFTVHVPSDVADPLKRADRTVFVRDGFSLAAFLFGPLFLAYRRQWVAALAWCATAALIVFAARALDLSSGDRAGLFGLLALLTGLEANEARRWSLARRGFIPAALFAGVTRENCERFFFGAVAPPFEPPRPVPGRNVSRMGQPAGEGEVIGLFPRPPGATG